MVCYGGVLGVLERLCKGWRGGEIWLAAHVLYFDNLLSPHKGI